MDWRNGIDVSSFFLVEASGDSEAADSDPPADSKPNSNNLVTACHNSAIASDDNNIDAESGSCDASYPLPIREVNYFEDQEFGESRVGEGCGEHERSESGCRACQRMGYLSTDGEQALEFAAGEEEEVESRVVVVEGSRETMMEEMENRLFWETCLKEGYP